MPKNTPAKTCPLCGRACALTKHHLIPKKLHRRVHFKKHFARAELDRCVMVCRKCHNGIHDLYDEMRLAKDFNSLEALQADADLQRHFAWVAKQKVR